MNRRRRGTIAPPLSTYMRHWLWIRGVACIIVNAASSVFDRNGDVAGVRDRALRDRA
jgi:hypothetical protein